MTEKPFLQKSKFSLKPSKSSEIVPTFEKRNA
jgi:hypothetical protein